MKTILYSIALIIFFASCGDTRHGDISSTAVSVIIDLTDKKTLWITANPVLALMDCEQNPSGEYLFHISAITNKRINPSFTSFLPDASKTEKLNKGDDAQFRNKSIVAFYASVENNFTDAYRQFDTSGAMAHSECWYAVTTELQFLAKKKATRKYLIIASDLMEKSGILDAYRSSSLSVQAIADSLIKAIPLPASLQGITVVCIYEPVTRESDTKFFALYSAYKLLLEKNGAVVKAQADNKHFDF